MTKAKTMNRARNQLATAYAPESFFTFEGGMGACISRSSVGEHVDLSDSTKDLIFERVQELGRSWFSTALLARGGQEATPAVLPVQCVDAALLNAGQTDFQLPGQDRFYLCRPSHMEYSPAPLTFVCRNCGLFRDYDSLAKLDKELGTLTQSRCSHSKTKGYCDWEQLDVIFVHWSGHWQAAFPGQFYWSDNTGKVVKKRSDCVCGGNQFRLNRRSPAIGDWFFECTACNAPLSPKWLQNDPKTLRMLGSANAAERLTEVRMQATPYRASSAYYVKSDLFIDFRAGSQKLLDRLLPGRETELNDFVAQQYGFSTQPLTDDDIVRTLENNAALTNELADYLNLINSIRSVESVLASLSGPTRDIIKETLNTHYASRKRMIEDLRKRQILLPKLDLPESVISNCQHRQSRFASKFDPFRLAVEHATLKNTHLDVETRHRGKKPYVSFTRLDEDLSPENSDDTASLQNTTQGLLDKLGFADMGLIREFDLCRFSFGYSRMESTPILRDKRGLNMPVRLNLFPAVSHDDRMKHPVYVIQQSNEALYVRLREDHVLEWLNSLNCPDMFTLNEGEKPGAGLLGAARPMSPFLDDLPETTTPPVYFYLYTLLHSFSHLLIKSVSEYSGLDQGSLGEYIFPADLAFVVYRNGTTMDLGNLASLWRNAGTAMLSSLLGAKATQCGTGSLCTARGGACPDCLMIPETSCLTNNKLLSRSVLRSIVGKPRFDKSETPIRGYLDIVSEKASCNNPAG